MNELKTNRRTFRYSDRAAKILEDYGRGNQNAGFEELVIFCYDSIPVRQKELDRINKMIESKKQEYNYLCTHIRDISGLIETLEEVQRYGEIAAQKAKQIAGEK